MNNDKCWIVFDALWLLITHADTQRFMIFGHELDKNDEEPPTMSARNRQCTLIFSGGKY